MAEIRIHFTVAMVYALVLAQLVSVLWFYLNAYWGPRIRDRHRVSGILCDACFVVLIKFVTENHWSVSNLEDSLMLSLWVALLYFCLEGPHTVHNTSSFSRFFFHTLHKFSVAFASTWALFYFKNY